MTPNECKDYILYRIEKSKMAYDSAFILFERGDFTGCVNRLYYAQFYIVLALCARHSIFVKTHTGMSAQLNLHFVKTQIVSIENAMHFAKLQTMRQTGDYDEFIEYTNEDIQPLIMQTQAFIKDIEKLILE